MEEEGGDIDLVQLEGFEYRFAGAVGFELGDVELVVFDEFHQEGGCSTLEPIVAEFLLSEERKNREGIENKVVAVPGVAIVPVLDVGDDRGGIRLFLMGQGFDAVVEIVEKLIVGVAQHGGVLFVHRDVVEVVEAGEDRYFREF